MAHVSKVMIVQSQNVTIDHAVQQLVITNGLPNWLYIRVGGSDLPNASNADIAVAPLSMGAFPIVPTRNFGIAVGDVTILVATNVPITQATCMFYEVPEPVTLGQVPLSPGGFRFRKNVNVNATLSNGALWSVDLSNFNNFRYSVFTNTSGVWWQILLYGLWSGVLGTTAAPLMAIFARNTFGTSSVSGVAGCIIELLLLAQDVNGNPASIIMTDLMEGW